MLDSGAVPDQALHWRSLSGILATGLADSALASLATLTVGVVATNVLTVEELALYALFFTSFLLSATVPAQLVFTPIENDLVGTPLRRQRATLPRSLLRGAAVSTACAVAVVAIVAAIAPAVDLEFSWPLAVTAAAAIVVSPLQDHCRRMLHQFDASRAAALVSSIQLATVVAAVVTLTVLGTPGAWRPLGALVVANVVSLTVAVFLLRQGDLGAPVRLALSDVMRIGRWLTLSAFVRPASGFLAYVVLAAILDAVAVGRAEAVRIVASPIGVVTIGMAAVFRPRVVAAAKRQDDTTVVQLHRAGALLAPMVAAAAVVAVGFDWPLNPLARLVPVAYEVPGLAAGMLTAAAIELGTTSIQMELISTGRERHLARISVAWAITNVVVVTLTAPAAGVWSLVIGNVSAGIVLTLGCIRARRLEPHRPGPDDHHPWWHRLRSVGTMRPRRWNEQGAGMSQEYKAGQVTVPGAMLRRIPLVVAIVGLCALLGLLVGFLRPASYQATASIVLRPPTTSVLTLESVSPERFVADQASIIETRVVAERTAEHLNEVIESGEAVEGVVVPADTDPFTADDVDDALSVATATDANLIEVGFTHETPEVAAVGANLAVDTYQEVRREQGLQRVQNYTDSLQETIDELDAEITELETSLAQEPLPTSGGPGLTDQYRDAIAQLAEIQARLAENPTDPQALADLNATGNLLLTLETAQAVESNLPEVSEILRELDSANERRSALQSELIEVTRDAEDSASPVTLSSPAPVPESAASFGAARLMIIGAILGLVPAALAAYSLETRRPRIRTAQEPQAILDAPMLGVVPDFRLEKATSLPVLDYRRTQAAEAFRFVDAGVQVYDRDHPVSVLAVISAGISEGKSVTTANISLVRARTAATVCVDLDFDGQGLSALLLGTEPKAGITELLTGKVELDDVLWEVPSSDGELRIVTGGLRAGRMSHQIQSSELADIIAQLTERFEFVVLDLPAILNVAYGNSYLRFADAAVAVVPHESADSILHEFADRLRLLGTPLVGYLYNRAPLQKGREASTYQLVSIPEHELDLPDRNGGSEQERPDTGEMQLDFDTPGANPAASPRGPESGTAHWGEHLETDRHESAYDEDERHVSARANPGGDGAPTPPS